MSPCSLVRPFVLSKVSESEREEEWRGERERGIETITSPLPSVGTDCHFKWHHRCLFRAGRTSALARFFILFLICIVRRPFVRRVPHIRLS